MIFKRQLLLLSYRAVHPQNLTLCSKIANIRGCQAPLAPVLTQALTELEAFLKRGPVVLTHCLYRFLDGKKKLAASNLAFQAFEGFIGT